MKGRRDKLAHGLPLTQSPMDFTDSFRLIWHSSLAHAIAGGVSNLPNDESRVKFGLIRVA